MLEKISSQIQSYFSGQPPASMALPPVHSTTYTSSLSSMASSKKGKGLIAGFVLFAAFVYLWKCKWNPL